MRDLLRLPSSRAVTTALFTTPHQQFFDTNGKPLAGGRLYAYDAGTTTYTDTWQDASGGTVNTNPVVLDSSGFATVWLDETRAYKFRMTNSQGVQQWTIDNYLGALATNILVPISDLLPAIGPNQIDNGSNRQIWTWELTGTSPTTGLSFGELTPSTNTNPLGSSSILDVYTLAGSTVNPFKAVGNVTGPGSAGTGLQISPAGDIMAIGGAQIYSSITGSSAQCVMALPNGQLVGTGQPCGSGGGPGIAVNFADGETVAGSGNNWTLLLTPNPVSSLQLYQTIPPFGSILLVVGTDYTISGNAITTTNSVAAGLLKAWYRW